MKNSRYALAGLLTLLLFVSVAYDLWNDRPYIVTGHQWDNGVAVVDFTLPGGGEGHVRFDDTTPWGQNCYAREVVVGEALPQCMRSFRDAFDAYPPTTSTPAQSN